jgi:hypothetical protein
LNLPWRAPKQTLSKALLGRARLLAPRFGRIHIPEEEGELKWLAER